jgi:hypothetical protein
MKDQNSRLKAAEFRASQKLCPACRERESGVSSGHDVWKLIQEIKQMEEDQATVAELESSAEWHEGEGRRLRKLASQRS